jgi:hypothetical protein
MTELHNTILTEAEALTAVDRQNDYGDPAESWRRIAKIWSGILGVEVTPQQAVLCMAGVKLGRLGRRLKRDSAVDAAGYLRLLERMGAV